MPIIRIQSLPMPRRFHVATVCKEISAAFSQHAAIDEQHISVIWQQLEAQTYTVAGHSHDTQPYDAHPLLVDLLVPSFHTGDRQQMILAALAKAITEYTPIDEKNVFIHLRLAASGSVYDEGRIQFWD